MTFMTKFYKTNHSPYNDTVKHYNINIEQMFLKMFISEHIIKLEGQNAPLTFEYLNGKTKGRLIF